MRKKRRNRLMTVIIESIALTILVVIVMNFYPVPAKVEQIQQPKVKMIMAYDSSVNKKDRIVVSRASIERLPIIDYSDITKPSRATASQIDSMLKGGLKGLGKYIIQAERDYNINALFLMALSRLESGNGTYRFMDRNNIFSFGAYDYDTDNAMKFDSLEACIDHVAHFLSREYLSDGGLYYNGLSLDSVGISYASDEEWAKLLREIIDVEIDKMK